MMETESPSSSGQTRSRSTPLTSAITAASANLRPMAAASSPAVVPGATWRAEPSGSVIVMSAIRRSYGPSRAVDDPFRGSGGRGPEDLRGAAAGRVVAVAARRLDRLGDVRGLRRDRLGLLRRVLVDVLLARELADLVHHLVDDLAQPEAVVTAVVVVVRVDRPTEAHLHGQPQLRHLGVGRHDLPRTLDPDRDDRRAGAQRQPGRTGVPAVELPRPAPGALGVDAEQLPPLEHLLRGREGRLARVAARAVDRDHAERR